jgi:hypothetical protein
MLWLGTVMILNSNNKGSFKRYADDKRKEADPKGWSTVLVTALGSWEKTVPCATTWTNQVMPHVNF